MALPIYGKYISRVYADKTLPYNQEARFKFPAGINLCESEFANDEVEESVGESIEGAFD